MLFDNQCRQRRQTSLLFLPIEIKYRAGRKKKKKTKMMEEWENALHQRLLHIWDLSSLFIPLKLSRSFSVLHWMNERMNDCSSYSVITLSSSKIYLFLVLCSIFSQSLSDAIFYSVPSVPSIYDLSTSYRIRFFE